MKQSLPNLLTVARLVMAAVFVALLTLYDYPDRHAWALPAAAALFALAAATDWLDGYLARKWNAISLFGRVMDPLADKILVLGAFVLLAGPAFATDTHAVSAVQPWMAVVILARELLVTSLRGTLEARGIDFSAGPAGKIKMAAQSVAAPAIMLGVAFLDEPRAYRVNLILAWAVTLATIVSALPYVLKAVRASRERPDSNPA